MKKKVQLRAYHPQDARALVDLFYYTVHYSNAQDYTAEQLEAWAPARSLRLERWQQKWKQLPPIVATWQGKVAGFAELEPNGHIDCFYVHYAFQGRGVGAALMAYIHEQAEQSGLYHLYAEVSITARPFFEKKGFGVVEEQTVMRAGVGLVNFVMEKSLQHAVSD